ncbi:MAG: hypothetical protein ACXWYP_02755 [Pseudonocardia sp.]
MTAAAVPTDQFVAYTRRGQKIATAAAEGYAGAFKAYAGAVVPQGLRPLDPQAATAAAFDLAEKLIAVQREYATATVALVKEAGDTATEQASAAGESLKAKTEQATERVIDFATKNTRRTATAARNGVSV